MRQRIQCCRNISESSEDVLVSLSLSRALFEAVVVLLRTGERLPPARKFGTSLIAMYLISGESNKIIKCNIWRKVIFNND